MRKTILALLIGMLIGSAVVALAAGATKRESDSKDAKSVVGYGTSDSGDTIVRFKTAADGSLCIQ